VIDSEQVPWGKGEKQPGKGGEIDLKPYAYKESERKCCLFSVRHGVPIEEWANELIHAAG
jgi:hypothetical protein